MPPSQIWGLKEQRKRLKMLISLGHYSLAADSFSKSSMDVVKRVSRDVEDSGDPVAFVSDLSEAFYGYVIYM